MTCMKYGILECVDNFGRYRQCKPVWVIVKMLFFYNSIPGRLFTIAGKFPEALAKLCEMELYERFKQSAQAIELLHERKMWNEQKPC